MTACRHCGYCPCDCSSDRAPAQPEPAAPLTWEQAVRSTITDPEYAERILALPDNATTEQIRAIRPEPAAPTEPAPGWCKHCRQYTIEEPLQAAPTVVEPVAWANATSLACAKVSRERGGPFDTHTWSEGKTQHHDTPLYLAATPPRAPLTDEAMEALRELVACEDLQKSANALHFAGPLGPLGEGWHAEHERQRKDYIHRQPLAWERARAVIAADRGEK